MQRLRSSPCICLPFRDLRDPVATSCSSSESARQPHDPQLRTPRGRHRRHARVPLRRRKLTVANPTNATSRIKGPRRGRHVAAAVSVASTLAAGSMFLIGAGAAHAATTDVLAGSKPTWASAAADRGAAPAAAPLAVRIYLAGRDPQGLAAYAQSVTDPKSAAYRHFLTPAQIQARFGASAEQVAAVKAWLAGAGLTVTGQTDGLHSRAGQHRRCRGRPEHLVPPVLDFGRLAACPVAGRQRPGERPFRDHRHHRPVAGADRQQAEQHRRDRHGTAPAASTRRTRRPRRSPPTASPTSAPSPARTTAARSSRRTCRS